MEIKTATNEELERKLNRLVKAGKEKSPVACHIKGQLNKRKKKVDVESLKRHFDS